MSNKILIIIVVVALLFIGIMGAGFFILWNKMSTMGSPEQVKIEETEEVQDEIIKTVFPLKSFVINLADKNGKRYLRTTLELEMSDEILKEEIEQRRAQVKNNILMILSLKTSEEARSPEGKTAYVNEIIEKLNSFLTKGTITNVYFTEFVIQ